MAAGDNSTSLPRPVSPTAPRRLQQFMASV